MGRYRVQAVAVVLSFALVARADAAGLPSFSGVMNKAIALVVEKNATRRGLSFTGSAATDTLAALGIAAGSRAALAVGAAAVATAPAWLSALAFYGTAALAAGVAYGVYKLYFKSEAESKALFTIEKEGGTGAAKPAPTITPTKVSETTYTYDAPPKSTDPYAPPTYVGSGTPVLTLPSFTFDQYGRPINTTGAYYVRPSYFAGLWSTCNVAADCMALVLDHYRRDGATINPNPYGTGEYKCDPVATNDQGDPLSQSCMIQYKYPWHSNWTVGVGSFDFAQSPYYSQPAVKLSGSIENIVSQIPDSELEKPADPAIVAAAANDLWQQAASQEGYKGVPYSASDPVTVADARAVQAERPAEWPTNRDLVSPVAASAGAAVTIGVAAPAVPAPDTGTVNPPAAGLTNVNVVNTANVRVDGAVDINWGTTATVHEPSIAATPTAQQILSPITTMMPGLRTLVIPRPASVCPTASFSVLDHAFTVDSHCQVVEAARPTLFAVMAFVWVAIGAMIVLRA